MTNSLLFHNGFYNSAFYDYLKSINTNVLIYYYPRLRTFLKDVFSIIEKKENRDGTKKYAFLPFYFDQSENLRIPKKKVSNFSTKLYIIPPDIKILSLIVKNVQISDNNIINNSEINEEDKNLASPENRIIFFPRKTDECVSWLNDHNSQNNHFFFDEHFVEFDYLPIDEKLLLIPFIDFFYRVFEKQDFSLLRICAEVLTKIQFFYGKIPKVKIHGEMSKKIYDMFLETTTKISDDEFPSNRIFNNLIIIDRTTDLLTLLLQQKSYDGYIGESFVLDDGMISIPNDNNTTTEYPITYHISSKIHQMQSQEYNSSSISSSSNSNDENINQDKIQHVEGKIVKEITENIHEYIKYKMIHHDIKYLNQILQKIRSRRQFPQYNSKDDQNIIINGKIYEKSDLGLIERSAQSLLNLVTKALNRNEEYIAYKELCDQLNLGFEMNFEGFEKAIQTFLYAEENALFATQLIMAWCMIQGSIPKDIYDEFSSEIEFRYGAQATEQLYFLYRINLITTNENTNSYSNLKNIFNLSVDSLNDLNSDGYEGYIPLSVRIIQEDLETIPGALTKRKEDNNDNINQNEEVIHQNTRNLSYVEMLSSTVGSQSIDSVSQASKRIDLFSQHFNDQYFCQNYKYVNSNHVKKDKKKPTLDGVVNNNEKTLIFFVGGITHLEVSWLNWLTEKHFKGKSSVVALTTGIFTAEKFIKECLPCLREDHPSLKVMTDNAIKLYSTHHY